MDSLESTLQERPLTTAQTNTSARRARRAKAKAHRAPLDEPSVARDKRDLAKAKTPSSIGQPKSHADGSIWSSDSRAMSGLDTEGSEELLFVRCVGDVTFQAYDDPWERYGTPTPRSPAEAADRLQEWLDHNVKTGPDLTADQKHSLDLLLCRHAQLFRAELGRISAHTYDMTTTDEIPVKARPLRFSPKERDYVRRQVEKMLNEGVIRHSKSAWSSAVVLVEKKDGTIRFAIDYKALNSKTPPDKTPIGNTQEVLDSLAGASWFSSLDARSGFYQQELEESCRHKTAFITHDGLYEWTRLPMGLKNAPSSFSRMMMSVLNGVTWQKCLVYLDDVLVFTNGTFEEHLADLDLVCSQLRSAGLTMKLSKCTFATTELIHLGHKITREGVACDPEKLVAIKALLPPTTKTDVRSFLGMVGYYRRFIQNFSLYAAPLEKHLEGTAKGPVTLGTDALAAWEHLRQALMSEPVMAYPTFSTQDQAAPPFVVKTDACNTQIGAALVQNGRPVAYLSRRLRGAELNWHTTEKECYAVVWALKKWRAYLLDEEFLVETDHAALLALRSKMGATPRLTRWALELQAYHYKLAHVKGKDHMVPDGISRLPFDESVNPRVPVGAAQRCAPGRCSETLEESDEQPRGSLRNLRPLSTADACFTLNSEPACPAAHSYRERQECLLLGCGGPIRPRQQAAWVCPRQVEPGLREAYLRLVASNAGLLQAAGRRNPKGAQKRTRRHTCVVTHGWNSRDDSGRERLPAAPLSVLQHETPWPAEGDNPPIPTFGLPWQRQARHVRRAAAIATHQWKVRNPEFADNGHACPGKECVIGSVVCATKRLQADRNGRGSADPFATEMWNPSVGKATESIHAIDTGSRVDPPTPGAWTDVAQPSPGESMRDAWVRESESYRLYVLEHYVPLNIDPVSFENYVRETPTFQRYEILPGERLRRLDPSEVGPPANPSDAAPCKCVGPSPPWDSDLLGGHPSRDHLSTRPAQCS